MTKKNTKTKLTPDLRTQIKAEFVQGIELESGERKHFTIDELIKKHNVASATLYRAARAENWKALRSQFEQEVIEELNKKRAQERVKEGSKLDDEMIKKSKEIIGQVDYYFQMNSEALKMKSRPFPPQHLLALCNALTVAQKLGKVAMGEVTENINVNSTVKEAESFREVMDLLHEVKRERLNSDSDSLH